MTAKLVVRKIRKAIRSRTRDARRKRAKRAFEAKRAHLIAAGEWQAPGE